MKAVILRDHGGVDKLLHEDIPTPEAGPGEVLVKIEAVALNHLDLWVRAGIPGLKLAYPHILGSDIAGTVAQIGAGVRPEGYSVGTPIVVNPGVSCMQCRECLTGHDNLCRQYGILGEHTRGGYAQFLAVPACNVVPRPASLTAAEAAAFPLTFLTAWQMLVGRARVRPGETVLVMAAGSGIGVAAIQIAKLHGARVIATATSDAKLEHARRLGADETINTASRDLLEAVKALTAKRGVDVVVEHIGRALWEKVILCTARGGRIVTCGATSGFDAPTDLRHVFFRQLSILGSTMGSKGDLLELLPHVVSGKLRPVVDRILPLAQAREAHTLLEDRAQFGKIVLDVSQ